MPDGRAGRCLNRSFHIQMKRNCSPGSRLADQILLGRQFLPSPGSISEPWETARSSGRIVPNNALIGRSVPLGLRSGDTAPIREIKASRWPKGGARSDHERP